MVASKLLRDEADVPISEGLPGKSPGPSAPTGRTSRSDETVRIRLPESENEAYLITAS